MTYPLRSTGITPLHHYYGAVRPHPAHRYFWPRGCSPLAPFPLASPYRFSRSIQEPGRESRHLYAGCRLSSTLRSQGMIYRQRRWSNTVEDDPNGHRIRLASFYSVALPAGIKIDGRTDRLSAFVRRSLCQMPLCVVGVELGVLRDQGAGGAVHLHRDLVERAGRRVMCNADPHNVL
jgi:hypothetical protein